MLLFPRAANPALYDRVLAALRALGLDPAVAHELPDVGGALAFIARSAGWYVSPRSVRDAVPRGVVFRPVHGLCVPFGIELMWRDEHAPAVLAFVKTVPRVRSGDAAGPRRAHLDVSAAG